MKTLLRTFGFGIAAFSVLASVPARALNIGRISLVGLANLSQYSVTPASGSKVTSDGYMGFGAGLLTEIELNKDAIGVEIGALYTQRKYGDSSAVLTETRVEVPALLRLRIGGIAFGAGVYGAYGLGNVASDDGSAKSYEARDLSVIDFGWVASGALTIGFGKKATKNLLIDGRMSSSLGNASSEDGATGHYLNFQLLTGLQFEL